MLTQKLHADFTVEQLKARICVDGSSEKPGEYADVSAHVAQLGTFKAQVGSTAELEGTLYSGDWTQAYLFALNTVPQYMAAPRAILSKHTYMAAKLPPVCGTLAVTPGTPTMAFAVL